MPFEIVRNDIAQMQVDAIVNSSSRMPRVNAGVNYAIHKKAGPELLVARKAFGVMQPGAAEVTPAFGLNADYVIHAVSPIWMEGLHGELQTLRAVYDRCLSLALERNCGSVAFPLLGAGNHGIPRARALQVAIASFSEFLMVHEMQIYLVVFGGETYRLSGKLFPNIESYIDENYVAEYRAETCTLESERLRQDMYRSRRIREPREIFASDAIAPTYGAAMPCAPKSAGISLDEFIRAKDAGFTETLLALIQKSGQKNSTIYKKANISKQHFSKIINDPNAKPSKPTAIALALALELDVDGTKDLIGRAGYTLTNSSTFDLIIQYFIERKQYNVIEINIALYEFDQSLLGA